VIGSQSTKFRLMYKMKACPKTWMPLCDGPVDDLLFKRLPLFNQTRLVLIDVRNAGAVELPFQYAQDVIP